MADTRVSAIILAAGAGKRMMSDITKQRMSLLGKTVIERTLEAFDASSTVDEIVVVARAEELSYMQGVADMTLKKPHCVVMGGQTRVESAKLGFDSITESSQFVAIHDGARCLITPQMIDSVIRKAFECGAATAVSESTDTLKRVDENGVIIDTIPRETVYRAQTPQVFSVDVYRRAVSNTDAAFYATDDNMMVEALGVDIYCVNLGQSNIKITTQDDLILAELILKKRG